MEQNKKELIKDYKNRKIVGGVYKITNAKTDSYWIGSSLDIDKITNRFNFTKATNTYFSLDMQAEWDEYGAEAFSLEILERLERKPEQQDKDFKEEVKLLEEMYRRSNHERS